MLFERYISKFVSLSNPNCTHPATYLQSFSKGSFCWTDRTLNQRIYGAFWKVYIKIRFFIRPKQYPLINVSTVIFERFILLDKTNSEPTYLQSFLKGIYQNSFLYQTQTVPTQQRIYSDFRRVHFAGQIELWINVSTVLFESYISKFVSLSNPNCTHPATYLQSFSKGSFCWTDQGENQPPSLL